MTTDANLRHIFDTTQTIAMVGASMKPERASNRVGHFLVARGYRVIPVNPGHAGKTLFGTNVVASLADITEPVDMLDIFRRSEHVFPVVQTALKTLKGLRFVWMQLDIFNADAREMAEARGLTVVEDRCPAIEIPRLMR